MRKVSVKALYLFLCAILGMILFTLLHRAIFVLYDLLVFLNYSFAAGMSDATIMLIDFLSFILALFLGGWYGTLLGIDWYSMVYGPNAERQAGLFHSFLPHHWRGKRQSRHPAAAKITAVKTSSAPATISTIVKVPVSETFKEAKEVTKQAVREWSFDDLITPKPVAKKRTAARKPGVKKTAVRKGVKKTAKAVTTE